MSETKFPKVEYGCMLTSGIYEVECEELGLLGIGTSHGDAIADFCSHLLHDFAAYAMATDGELDEQVLARKNQYLALAGREPWQR